MPRTIQLTLSGGSNVVIEQEGQRWRVVRSEYGFLNPSEGFAYYIDLDSVAPNSNIRFEIYPIENGEVNFKTQPNRVQSGRPAIKYVEMTQSS